MKSPFPTGDTPPTLTVSQLNRQVKSLLEGHFDFIWVEGEVSNFAAPSSGHWYFSLKDGNAQVRCAMFRNRNQRMKFTPQGGDALRLRARVSLYEGRGEFQLIVEHLEHAGAGDLQAAFEKLKGKLHAEGLFDPKYKQPLPELVSRLGVITSPTGAAIHDILQVLKRRCPAIEVSLFPVAVQGEGAAAQISTAIENANRWQREGELGLDALVVGRGGGSLEDLWPFNEEVVARAIAASELPVVSAVGHEVDFTIADMAADYRAPTPSAAAELLSPDQQQWLQDLAGTRQTLLRLVQRQIRDRQSTLSHLRERLRHPRAQLRENSQRLDDLEQRMIRAQRYLLQQRTSQLALQSGRLQALSPLPRLHQAREETRHLRGRLESGMSLRLRSLRERLAHLGQVLDSLSPLGTLQRGYAIVSDADDKPVLDATQLKVGDKVRARLASGKLGLTVDTVEPGE